MTIITNNALYRTVYNTPQELHETFEARTELFLMALHHLQKTQRDYNPTTAFNARNFQRCIDANLQLLAARDALLRLSDRIDVCNCAAHFPREEQTDLTQMRQVDTDFNELALDYFDREDEFQQEGGEELEAGFREDFEDLTDTMHDDFFRYATPTGVVSYGSLLLKMNQ